MPPNALQACLTEATREAPGLMGRWVAGLHDALRQQESWVAKPAQRAELSKALQELLLHKQALTDRWVDNWREALAAALRHPGQVGTPKRSLASINFDDLELMDDVQIQATVQVARLEQSVQGAAGDVLSELNALLSAAQGFASVKPEHNPMRPDVAVTALRLTLEGVTPDKAVRSLWLQHGSEALGRELQVLYRHLLKVLQKHGVKPVDYHVVQAPSAPTLSRTLAAGRPRPAGLADQLPMASSPAMDGPDEVTSSALMTLDGLHDLLVTGPGKLPDQPVAPAAPQAPLPMIDIPRARLSGHGGMASRMGAGRLPVAQKGTAAPPAGSVAVNPLQALAGEVVSLMLDGMTRDPRLLPPVKVMLRKLEAALLRIAHDDPRFFVDRQNPARRLLDDITQRSLAFSTEQAPGFARFHATLEDLVPLLERTDVRLTSLFETALDVLASLDQPEDERLSQDKARGRAVASLVQAEQRFMVADRVAKELAARRDFPKADRLVCKFLLGPWAQVIAQARLAPPPADAAAKSRIPAEMRYLGVVSDLIWSSRVDVASLNRSRLARLIPGLLRTLREGLQTIEYDGAHSRHFLGTLMGLHAAALTVDPAGGTKQPAPTVASKAVPDAQDTGPWMKPAEAADSGFMDSDFPLARAPASHGAAHVAASDAGVDGVDVPLPDDVVHSQPGPVLETGAWIELCRESGEWVRLQLAWMSPHGLMYLFGNHGGRTSSMSRRHFEDMFRAGRIRLVAAHSVVDDALVRVLDVATRNSARKPAPPGHDTVYPDLLPPLA